MPVSLDGQLVVAISSRALFDFEEENRVFEEGMAQPLLDGAKPRLLAACLRCACGSRARAAVLDRCRLLMERIAARYSEVRFGLPREPGPDDVFLGPDLVTGPHTLLSRPDAKPEIKPESKPEAKPEARPAPAVAAAKPTASRKAPPPMART